MTKRSLALVLVLVIAGCGDGENGMVDAPGGGDGPVADPTTFREVWIEVHDEHTLPTRAWVDVQVPAATPNTPGWCWPETMMGVCRIRLCLDPDHATGGPNMGVVTATGNLGSLVAAPDANGHYPVASDMRLFDPGQTVTVTAPGGALPAINETFTAQPDIMVTSPIEPTINRGTPMVVTWTGGGTGTVHVTLGAIRGALRHQFRCTFPASAGTGTVPSEVLKTVPVGSSELLIAGSEHRKLQTDPSVSLEIALQQTVRLTSPTIQ